MYSIDHSILQLKVVIKSLEKEEERAQAWVDSEEMQVADEGVYKTKYMTPNTLLFIDKYYYDCDP